ncbi:MAG: CBS domain-containing protein [Burkholderiales bacterium]
MKTVRQLLEAKEPLVLSVAPDARVIDALRCMADKRVGAVLVMEDGRLKGIFTERDYARKIALEGRTSAETLVGEVMTAKVIVVKPTQTLDECMAIMTEKRCRHLPVLDGDKVLGMISIGDCVRETISEQEFIIHQLENYIMH